MRVRAPRCIVINRASSQSVVDSPGPHWVGRLFVSTARFFLIVLAYVIGLPLFGLMYAAALFADRFLR